MTATVIIIETACVFGLLVLNIKSSRFSRLSGHQSQ